MCSDRVVVRLRDVSKSYHVYDRPVDRLKQLLWGGHRQYGRMFHALRHVSLELRRGEVLGVVGRNGAGKSTLLQLLCGTLTPTSGTVEVQGRVAALLELGAGFNPDFTGRENVFLYGAVLGMPREEIARRFDEIVAFAGLGDFIDQPVKTYSSGMYVRLAFSIATSVEPDVLVVDEALSVGDGEFARKSFDRIMALRDRGTTILFCSHSLYQVEALCTRAIWLDKGGVQRMGDPADVVAAYGQAMDRGETGIEMPPSSAQPQGLANSPQGYARIEQVTAGTDERSGRDLRLVTGHSDLWVEVCFACDPALPPPSVAVTIHAMDGRTICSAATHLHGLPVKVNAQGRGVATVRFRSFGLLKGTYFVSAHLLCERGIHLYQTADQVATIEVKSRDVAQGVVWLPNEWSLTAQHAEPMNFATRGGSVQDDDALAWLSERSRQLTDGETLAEVPAGLLCPERLLPRFGFEQNETGIWVKTKTPRWRVAWVGKEQSAQWMRLFETAFGHRMPPEQWQWKYRDTTTLGVGAYAGEDLIAFYGGMPRRAIWQGKPIEVVQVGDVMVEPSQRGVLTRQGPFQLVATTYLEQCIGENRRFLLGYGFPSSTAMRLAERLGLYAPVDRFLEVSWPAWTGGRNWWFKARALTLGDLDTVSSLWAQMAGDLPNSIVGVRDGAYVRARFLEHPTIRYAVLLVSHRLSGKAAGVVVLNDRGDEGLELLDVIGPCRHWRSLVEVGRRFAAGLGRHRLFGWITASHADRLDAPERQIVEMDLHVPTNVWSPGPTPEQVRGRWLLMGGDSDFR